MLVDSQANWQICYCRICCGVLRHRNTVCRHALAHPIDDEGNYGDEGNNGARGNDGNEQ